MIRLLAKVEGYVKIILLEHDMMFLRQSYFCNSITTASSNFTFWFFVLEPFVISIYFLACINYIAETISESNLYFLIEEKFTSVMSARHTFRYEGSGAESGSYNSGTFSFTQSNSEVHVSED